MRIPSLDGLRAFSIAFVIVGHAAECGLAPKFLERYASFGVNVFFVISGYLITTLLLKEKRIDLKAFYVRRFLRIFPAAYVFMMAMVFIYHLTAREYIPAFAYLSNYNASRPWVVGHLWSLAVEEQFYLIWPIVMAFFGRNRAILIGTTIAAPISNIILHFAHLSAYIGTAFPSVADSLALGCLGAIIGAEKFRHWIFSLAAPLTLVLQCLHVPASITVLILWPLIHTGIALFVLHAVARAYSWLNIRVLGWIGVLSYSIYLWQQPLLNPANVSDAKALLILPLAIASYYLIERPFLKLKQVFQFARPNALLPSSPSLP